MNACRLTLAWVCLDGAVTVYKCVTLSDMAPKMKRVRSGGVCVRSAQCV